MMDQKAEQSVPALNYDADYVRKALAIAYKSESLQVETFHSQAITKIGENFCSAIYRLNVTYRKDENAPLEHGRYIVKDLIPEVAAVGSNEMLMFEEILPAMSQILSRAPSTFGERKLSAECFSVERAEAKEIYLLEDLGDLGYESFDRVVGLSLDDARLCLKKLAHFHAASMLLLHEQPALVQQLKPCHYHSGLSDPFAKSIVLGGMSYGATVADELGMSSIADKMRAQLPSECEARMCSTVDPKNSAIKVINHGDLWLNNILINTAESETILVDFQQSFIGSPAIDLHFLFYTSLQLDVLLQHKDTLLKDYHDELCHTLTAINYPLEFPSYAQLLAEVERCIYYGFYGAVCELALCCTNKEAAEGLTIFTLLDEAAILAKRRQIFASERVRKTLKATLGYFEEHGCLEMP